MTPHEGVKIWMEHTQSNRDDAMLVKRGQAWNVFLQATGHLVGVVEEELKQELGLSISDYNLLLALWERPNYGERMGELAKRLRYSPSRVTYLVSHLTDAGYVSRVPSASDRRSFDAHLTDGGRKVVTAGIQLHRKVINEALLTHLSEEELDQVISLLIRLDPHRGHEDRTMATENANAI
ncbi:MarR family transcriptional regulator [Schaalia sp. ZJ1691]|uniref:MarR family winged helix-turn-helix transcriptional regulator n=1 Tax=Schaalia sp. ZJ1691 TaxID=2709404 RepID=UPI001F14E344|nr:MarR family transcriptional regulator [Schaalia sp. ZJ1691]